MRNYKKESEWSKIKYKRLVANIDHYLNNIFKEKLKKENTSFQKWLKEKIKEYINL